MRKFITLLLMVSFGLLQAQTDTVTFQVDLNNYTGSFTTANVNGTFNAWCGACNPMTDANSDGIWEVSLPLTAGTIEYKFTLDGWTNQENFSPGGTCTVTNSGFTNRALTFSGDTTLGVVCWESCSACGPAGPVLSQVDLPITFDDTTVSYSTTSFGGNIDSIAPDPTNAFNNVLVLNKPMGAQTWAGTTVSTGGLATAIPFSATDNIITVRVWSADPGVTMRLKAEDANDPTKSVETEATTTQAGAWETLSFDFSAGNQATGTAAINYANTYDMLSFFPNFGTDGNTAGNKTYYVDDFIFGTNGPALSQVDLPITFNDNTVAYTTVSFGGNLDSIVPDPTNAANNVLFLNKPIGAQTWAGTTISDGGLATAIPFSATDNIISIRVWSPDSGVTMRLKAEDANDPAISVETEAVTTMAGAWETLTFDFSAGNEATGTAVINYANTYDMLSFFPNFGTDGNTAGNKIYYIDDVVFGAGGVMLTQVDLPITFDDPNVAYTTVSFGGNIDSIAADPTNAANNVLVINKPMGTQTWAGTTISDGGLANAIPFTATDNIITVRVWSPDAGVPMRLKAEDANDPTISVETEAVTTMAGAWETLTFDFSAGNEATGTAAINYANTYDMLSFFPNFGTDGNTAGNKTYYIDDVVFGAGGGGGPMLTQVDLPITWEDPTVDYASAAFGGASDTIVTDPTNASNTVLEITKDGSAQAWAGVTVSFGGLANPVPFTATETTMTVRVWSPNAGTDVLLKVEDDNDGAIAVETIATTTAAATWETLTFDFTNHAAGTPALDLTQTYDVVTVFPNFGTDGAAQGGPLTFYVDDVMFDGGIGLNETFGADAFSFSPNPSKGSFDVRLSLDSPQATLSIVNLAGKLMHNELLNLNGNNSLHHIDVQSLPKGIYLINVSNGVSSHSDKIVIE